MKPSTVSNLPQWIIAMALTFMASAQQSTVPPTPSFDPSSLPISLDGRALDESGQPLVGVEIVLQQISGAPVNTSPRREVLHSTRGGRFFAGNLAPGVWRACGSLPFSEYLDPCEWDAPVVFTARPGKSLTGLKVILKKGQLVHIRVEDSDKKLKSEGNGNKGKSGSLEIGVTESSGRFHGAKRMGEDASGEFHLLAVPLRRPVQFSAKAKDFDFDLQVDGGPVGPSVAGAASAAFEGNLSGGSRQIKLVGKGPKK